MGDFWMVICCLIEVAKWQMLKVSKSQRPDRLDIFATLRLLDFVPPSVHILRIHVFLVRFLGLFEGGLELLLEDAGTVFLALELALEALRGLALLRLEALHHRLERAE